MIKQGDKVVVVRPESTRRQATVEELAKGSNQWIDSKPEAVEHKATIGYLGKLFIPVRLPDRKIKKILYPNLTFTKAGVSFISHRPDWKGIKKGKEVLIPGKPITVRGKAVLNGLYIPVVIDGKTSQLPYEQIKFKKESK